MQDLVNKYILVTGLMGSGKSTIINEYMLTHETEEFIRPPVEAKFRGMEFEFIDQIFALSRNGFKFNFYELDAPTINKWNQFVEVANAIIIVYNMTKQDYYESPEKFISNVKQYTGSDIPIYFVVNNCDDQKSAEKALEELFTISQLENPITIFHFEQGDSYYTKKHGKRVKLDLDKLNSLYSDIIGELI